MNQQLVSELNASLTKRNFDEVISLSDSYLQSCPRDIAVIYCNAMAHILADDVPTGLSRLMEIIAFYGRSVTQDAATSTGSERVGQIALQMMSIAELYRVPHFEKYCIAGARAAMLIGKLIGKETLIEQGQQVLERLWTRKDGQRQTHYLRASSPPILQIEPTNRCNMKCTMCARNHMTRPKGYIDISLFRDIISGWKSNRLDFSFQHVVHGCQVDLFRPGPIKLFFMGEPLLHKQIASLVQIGREKGCHVAVQTNGLLLSKKAIRDELLQAAPSEIAASLDGIDRHSYEHVRGGGRWDRAVHGLEALRNDRDALGLTEQTKIRVSTIIEENTEAARSRAREFLKPIASTVDEILFIQLEKSYSGEFFSSDGVMEPYSRGKTDPEPSAPLCTEPLGKLNILWNGDVTPCCTDINGDLCLGSVTSSSIDDIWNSRSTVALQRGLFEHDQTAVPECWKCRYS